MTGHSKDLKIGGLALGVRAHSGWAAYVVLRSPASAPSIVARGVMQLCDAKVEGSKQPFHHAEPMPFNRAEAFLQRCKASSDALAEDAICEIVAAYGALKGCCILTATGKPLPALQVILSSHALIHAAEGEFYRTVVRQAAMRKDIPVEIVKERDLSALADRLPGTEETRRDILNGFGKQVGSPWRQDQKYAATAAWFVLAMRQSRISSRAG